MLQKEYWDRVSETKNFTTPFQAEEFAEYVEKDALIADIGCGYGRTLAELYAMGYRNLVGFDISDGMIRRGRKLHPFLDLRVMEEGKTGLADSSADAVILFAVLTCIPADDDQKRLVREVRRILKPGGILYVNDFLLNSDERNRSRYDRYAAGYGTYGVFELPEGAAVRHHSEEHVEKLLRDFTKLRYGHLTFTTMNGNRSNGFFYIGQTGSAE